jgi:hypothetical protein
MLQVSLNGLKPIQTHQAFLRLKMVESEELTKQFAKTLRTPISVHVEKHGLTIVGNDILIAHDPYTGRIVITFEVFKSPQTKLEET